MSENLKKLTGKFGYEPVAKHLINNCDTKLFQELIENDSFLFDFVKQNVAERLSRVVNENNYKNLLNFLEYYSPFYEDFIVKSLVKYANEDLTDELLEKFENGTENEKTYCAKYFSYIQDPLAIALLQTNAFSDNDALLMNCAQTLAKFQDKECFNHALELLKSDDEFEKLKAVKFLVNYGDKAVIPVLTDVMRLSAISENIAGEIPYLENLFTLLDSDYDNALLIINYIVNGLGEILSLNSVFDYELFEVFEKLINTDYNSKSAVVLLNAKDKFDILTDNDEYLFDEDKNTKNEILDIKNLLKNIDKKEVEKYINEELNENSPFVFTALDFATDLISIRELLKSNNQTLILKTAETLKRLGNFDETARTIALLKVNDVNIKAIIRAL